MPVSYATGLTTSSMRGKGGAAATSPPKVALEGCKVLRLFWTASDDEVVTPGSGGVPAGVQLLSWVPVADNQACSIYFDYSTRLGTFAVESGTPLGYLIIHYKQS